jgi:hypothetical protein
LLQIFTVKVFFKINNIFILLVFIVTSCQRTLNWDLGSKGSLKDAQGICFPYTVHGNFYNGTSTGSDTSYVEMKVNVFTPGDYSISTDLQNGLRFFVAGSFSDTGIHLVKLKPTGKAFITAQTNFAVSFDTSVCSFTIDVTDTINTTDILNTWKYTDVQSNRVYQGTINATHLIISAASNLVSLRHEITNTADTTFDITIEFPNGIATGTYATDIINNVALSYQNICINCAWNVAYQLYGALTNIVITAYDPQTKIIKGTFSGTTINGENNVLPVKNGSFYAQIK